ncbi:MAG: hemolysin [Bacteroidetes bacterium]|nr:hemolysin [Bacteroidota bacterium]
MIEIIPPVDTELLLNELTADKLLRPTNKANNHIYVVTAHDSPHVMREIGRLRELSFRSSGGGTGLEMDMDEFDTMEEPYRQLIVWNEEEKEIMGGYRFLHGQDMKFDTGGQPIAVTSHMFHFSPKFIAEYLPKTIDLGRAFVQPAYQSSHRGAKSLFALDNLWDGLGALATEEQTEYLIGKVTIYPDFNAEARDMILYFMYRYFNDDEGLVALKEDDFRPSESKMQQYDAFFHEKTFKDNYRKLNLEVRRLGVNIPALINAYIGLSPTMKTFGTGINQEFANIYDTGIMITVADIFEEKRRRHIEPYLRYKASFFGSPF